MLGKLASVDPVTKELQVMGYIKQNYLNVKRLMHITGVSA